MRVIEVITVEQLKLALGVLKYNELSFTEQAIIEKFINKIKPRKAIMVDELKIFIEKEIEIDAGEENEYD